MYSAFEIQFLKHSRLVNFGKKKGLAERKKTPFQQTVLYSLFF